MTQRGTRMGLVAALAFCSPAIAAMADAIALIDPDSPMIGHYRWRYEQPAP